MQSIKVARFGSLQNLEPGDVHCDDLRALVQHVDIAEYEPITPGWAQWAFDQFERYPRGLGGIVPMLSWSQCVAFSTACAEYFLSVADVDMITRSELVRALRMIAESPTLRELESYINHLEYKSARAFILSRSAPSLDQWGRRVAADTLRVCYGSITRNSSFDRTMSVAGAVRSTTKATEQQQISLIKDILCG